MEYGKPFEHQRSPHWSKVRNEHLEKEPACAVCGGTQHKNVHHILPFHLHPERELDPENLITLCEGEKDVNCHLFVGHLGNFRGWNPNVREDAEEWKKKLFENKERIAETKKQIENGGAH